MYYAYTDEEKNEEGECPSSNLKDTTDEDNTDDVPIKKGKKQKGKKQKGGDIINPQIQIYALILSGIFYILSKYKKQTTYKQF